MPGFCGFQRYKSLLVLGNNLCIYILTCIIVEFDIGERFSHAWQL